MRDERSGSREKLEPLPQRALILSTVAVLLLLYAPLGLGWAEGRLFGTSRVYSALDSIGLAEPLDRIYPSAVDWGEPFIYFEF